MRNYKHIATLTMCGVAAVGSANSADNAPNKQISDSKQPNVVFVLADDMGIGDLGAYGQRIIRTPYIDSLAARGVQFMQHYSGSTVSAPSRAVLLTGKHTGHCAIRGNKGHTDATGKIFDFSLPDAEVTLAEQFRKAGYATGVTGKWGLGSIEHEGSPLNQGFDYFFGYRTHIEAHKAYPKVLWENTTKIELNGTQYADELILNKALGFIDRSSESGKPFFLYYTTTLPHAELIVPSDEITPYVGKVQERPYRGSWYESQQTPASAYAAMVTRIDRNVGRIVGMLREKGELDNTIIVFTSDNGTHAEGGADPTYFDSNSLYRGIKRDLYEGGVRVPMIISWPEVIAPGGVSYHVSAFWDFMPTFSEIIGIPSPKGTDGISMVPSLTGRGSQRAHDYLYWEFHEEGGKQSLLQGDWKLIRLAAAWQNTNPEKLRYELYNLARDPKELRSVATSYPERVEQMRKIMDASRTNDPEWNFTPPKQ